MTTKLRFVPEGGALVEVTCRTVESRFLLKPSPELESLTLGILARAYAEYPIELVGVTQMSNHIHLLIWVETQYILSRFMEYLNGNLAREVNRLRDRTGPLWERRYEAIIVTDEEKAQVARFKYLLSQGVKENLVAKVKHWPGLHSGKALLEDRSILAGTWISRTAEYRNKNRKTEDAKEETTSTHEIPLAQLPCWKAMTYGDYCKEVRRLIREIEEEAALERKLAGTEVLGAPAVLEVEPQFVPKETKTSYAPRVHAASKQARIEFREAYGMFLADFLDAAEDLRNGVKNPSFPEGCFPPGLPYVGETGLPPDPGD